MVKVQNSSTKDDEVVAKIPAACADEKAAVEFMEEQRWGKHPACPRCGDLNVYQMKDLKTGERQANFRWRCHGCKEQFTVRIGTVFEDSRIPLKHWCYGFWRASTSKKGVSALEIHRQTGLSYKSALFLLHRIRYAMNEQDVAPLSGDVEVDEVFLGGAPRHYNNSRKTKPGEKTIVVGLKQRGGNVRPRIVADVTSTSLKNIIRENVEKTSRILTDEGKGYLGIGKEYAGGHETVRHSTFEYARGDVHTNSIEGFFGMLRRGLDGIYHSVSKKHLHRYLSEFEFRHNYRKLADGERTVMAIRSANNKRLTYAQQVENE
jgi:transposase-like protein